MPGADASDGVRPLVFNGGGWPHLVNHLAPIYLALPDELKGLFFARDKGVERCRYFGIEPTRMRRLNKNDICVVASHNEYRQSSPAQVIYVNHGAGQTYQAEGRNANNPSYSGGTDRDRAILFICPSERDAEVNRLGHPQAEAVAAGVPYLDRFHGHVSPKDGPIGITWHADIRYVSETRTAFPHYKQALIDLIRSREFDIIGHCHPRAERNFKEFWRAHGVRYEPDYFKVLEESSLLVVDNSSSLYEAAALDKPVAVLSAPWYRRHVHHGLRFWDQIPGVHIEEPDQLASGIRLALSDPPDMQARRREVVQHVYGNLIDGRATFRAVSAIRDIIGSLATV